MRLAAAAVQAVGQEIEKAKRIVLITHRNPDGDAIGSTLAMYEMLVNMGKKPVFYCADPIPEAFYFLPNNEEVTHTFQPENFDLAIMLDCGASSMANLPEAAQGVLAAGYPLINIDHHASNDDFGKWNLVDPEAASATEILTDVFLFLGWKITPKIATCLMTGLYTDTGSLKHSNATAQVHRVAAELLKRGARLSDIVRYVFKSTKVEVLRLWGTILARISRTPEGITMSHVTDEDFSITGTTAADTTGVIDYLNAVPDAQFALLLTETGEKVKGSLRTMQEDVDLNAIAAKLGGGGHRKASGFSVPGKLQMETRFRIVGEETSYDDALLSNSTATQ